MSQAPRQVLSLGKHEMNAFLQMGVIAVEPSYYMYAQVWEYPTPLGSYSTSSSWIPLSIAYTVLYLNINESNFPSNTHVYPFSL